MADTYENWAQLSAANIENTDYRLPQRRNNSVVTHIAIHGGAIEPGTSEVASEVAAANYQSYYGLEGIKAGDNSSLHLMSTHYDEPIGINIVGKSNYCFSYHGYTGTLGVAETTVGGLDTVTRDAVIATLTRAGFTASVGDIEMDGTDPNNITNKTSRAMGVQIEMSNQLRANFFPGGDMSQASRESGVRTDTFFAYAHAIASAANGLEVRSQQTPNYDLNEPLPTDQMGDFETWLNANWTKLTGVNKFAVYPELPTSGNFKVGDRVIRQVDKSAYVCICNDRNWGIFWRPIQAPISPWRTIGDGIVLDGNWSVADADRPLQCAIDHNGLIHWRGLIKWVGSGSIGKGVSNKPFQNLPDGIQPRGNVSVVVGHSVLTVTAGGTPATEWEGAFINIPHDPIGGALKTIEILVVGGNGTGNVTKIYLNGQLNWPIGKGVWSSAHG